jgi:hypothetical protein
MASKDPLSQSTGYNGIHGDYYSCVTFDNLTEDNEVYVILYYPLYSGWDFSEYPFLFKKPNEAACWAMSRFKRDGLGNVWGQGKYPQFLSFVGQVMMKRCEVQVALESPTTKSKIENCFFNQVIFHLSKKNSILLSSDYIQLSEKTFFQCITISPQTLSTKTRCHRPFRIVPYTCTFEQYLRTFVPYDGTYGAPD